MNDELEKKERKKIWKRRLIELAFWASISVLTALLLVYAADHWLPSNF